MAKKLEKEDIKEDGDKIEQIIDTPPKTPKVVARKSSNKGKKKEKKCKSSRSKKYIGVSQKIESQKKYNLEEAVKLAKASSYSKFDGTLSLSVKLEKSKKSDD
ncbi:MAG: hypothetical protein Q8M92_06200, partial [Candidatus Subteraquimicrobiales bacterium]|nr:hypothetical protein [Candidatus Subteraquimicrobiales bacterium]